MKYFAIYDELGKLTAFGTSSAATVTGEITEAQYLELKQEVEMFNGYVNAVYSGDMFIEDVPEEYRAEVEARVVEMKKADSQPEPMSDVDEALAILHGEVTE